MVIEIIQQYPGTVRVPHHSENGQYPAWAFARCYALLVSPIGIHGVDFNRPVAARAALRNMIPIGKEGDLTDGR